MVRHSGSIREDKQYISRKDRSRIPNRLVRRSQARCQLNAMWALKRCREGEGKKAQERYRMSLPTKATGEKKVGMKLYMNHINEKKEDGVRKETKETHNMVEFG